MEFYKFKEREYWLSKKLRFVMPVLVIARTILNLSLLGLSQVVFAANYWIEMGYLHQWIKDSPIGVPLVTQNNNSNAFGKIGEAGTQILFGSGSNNNRIQFGGMNGAQVVMGGWLDNRHRFGFETTGFGFWPIQTSYSYSSVNRPGEVVNIPFISTTSGQNVLVNRLPNTVSIRNALENYGFELNGLYNLEYDTHTPVMFLAGFRYFNLNENFLLKDSIPNPPSFPNATANINDNFITKNNFYAVQLGARGKLSFNNLDFEMTTKLALGDNYQKLNIFGQTNLNNATMLQPIGLFAEPSNTGKFKQNQFAVLPEIEARVGYHFTSYLHSFVAYNCTYLNKVIRPGDQIDNTINQSQNPLLGGSGVLVGSASPRAQFSNSSLWLQGVRIGIQLDL